MTDIALSLLNGIRADEAKRRDLQLRWVEALEEIADLLAADASGDVAAVVSPPVADSPAWSALTEHDRRVVAEAWINDCVESDAVVPIDYRALARERQQAGEVQR